MRCYLRYLQTIMIDLIWFNRKVIIQNNITTSYE